MLQPLRLVHPASIQHTEHVEVGFGLAGDRLRVRFEVQSNGLHLHPDLEGPGPHWGLWDWDVVELFLHVGSSEGAAVPYYEFQVSPLGQTFELLIRQPRKDTDTRFRSGFLSGAWILEDENGRARWEAWMEIPLRPLGWTGQVASLRGGAFAILGDGAVLGPKRFWSLFLQPQKTPDFHLPDQFRPLFGIPPV